MSYAQFDDKHDYNFLTKFRERLTNEVRAQSGNKEFTIFQDRIHIKWGENWQRKIEETLDSVTFLIPVMTPNFFNSPACLEEVQRFAECERHLLRDNLILPVYYLDARPLEDDRIRAEHPVARLLHSRQRADLRDLRGMNIKSASVERKIRTLAREIADTIQRTTDGTRAAGSADQPSTTSLKRRRTAFLATWAIVGIAVAGVVAWKLSTGPTGADQAGENQVGENHASESRVGDNQAVPPVKVAHQVRSHTLTSSSSMITCSRDKLDFDTAEPGHGNQAQMNLCKNSGGLAEVILDPERLHAPGDKGILLPLVGEREAGYGTCRDELSRHRDRVVGTIDLSDLHRGELICVRTDQRLIASMTIDRVVPGDPSTVTFDVTVWEPAR